MAEKQSDDTDLTKNEVNKMNKFGTDKNNELVEAVVYNNESKAIELIKAGADVNIADAAVREVFGKSALCYALENKTENMAIVLINVGASVNKTDCRGQTPLFHAHSCKDVWPYLVKATDDINLCNTDGETALLNAVLIGNEIATRALIKAGADVNITDNLGKTALFYAHESVVPLLVEEGNARLDTRDHLGRTPLFYAIARSLETTRYILKKGSNLQEKDYHNKSIFSFAFEDCLKFPHRDASLVYEFFVKSGTQSQILFDVIINIVFCKILSKPGCVSKYSYASGFVTELPSLAKLLELAKHKNMKGVGRKSIENILIAMRSRITNNENLYKTIASKILPLLTGLGANSNSVDSDGNTALHYATRLPFFGVSQETVMKICQQLKRNGALFNIRNHQNETPLLFCLSRKIWIDTSEENQWQGFKTLIKVCQFLLENGSSVEETTKQGESVFHLILVLIQNVLKCSVLDLFQTFMKEALTLLPLLCNVNITKIVTINKRDVHLNSPLHLWGTLEPNYTSEHMYQYPDDFAIERILGAILKHFLQLGVKLNDRNENDETPLHLCRTWSAVKLLLDAGANPNDLDSVGSSPLLVAAKNRTFLRNKGLFYSDISQEPKEFWTEVLAKGLDTWTVDKYGESVLSILIFSGSFALANGMIEAVCEKDYLELDTVAIPLLNTICKDKSQHGQDKAVLLKTILKSKKSLSSKINENSPLHFCCRNVVETSKDLHHRTDIKSTVLWVMTEELLFYGADYTIPDESGKTCLDIAEECPELKELLRKPVDSNTVVIT